MFCHHFLGNLRDLKQKLLYPFTKFIKKQLIDDLTVSSSHVNAQELAHVFKMICPTEHQSHKNWITGLAKALLHQFPQGSYLHLLIPVALLKVRFVIYLRFC